MKYLGKIASAVLGAALLSVPVAASAADYYGAFAFCRLAPAAGRKLRLAERSRGRGSPGLLPDPGSVGLQGRRSFVNSCAALAVGGDNGWGADWGANIQAAENKALHTCSGYSYNCRVLTSQCSNGQ